MPIPAGLYGGVGGVQVGWRCVKLDGSMSIDARDRMINTFSHDPDCKVRTSLSEASFWRAELVVWSVSCFSSCPFSGLQVMQDGVRDEHRLDCLPRANRLPLWGTSHTAQSLFPEGPYAPHASRIPFRGPPSADVQTGSPCAMHTVPVPHASSPLSLMPPRLSICGAPCACGQVFLMSLKAGGVALNLTVASHVFLMDPWWNPAVEQQAQDRIHRLGQYKPIR